MVQTQQLYQYFPGHVQEILIARAAVGQHVQNDLTQGVQRWEDRMAGGALEPGQPRGAEHRGLEALERAVGNIDQLLA
eukprot:11154906-Lingulodinium_polyedra.AAC.1